MRDDQKRCGQSCHVRKIGVIVNRMNDEAVLQYLDFDGVPVIATIGDDKNLTKFDLTGENVFNLPDESEVVRGVKKALSALKIINKQEKI